MSFHPEAADIVRFIAIPLIGAFIGWATNALAVRMIFRPHRPRRVLGLTIQGLVPRRREELARSIAETVEQHLISHADVLAILERSEMAENLDHMIHEKINDFLDNRLGMANPMFAMFLSGSLRDKVEELLVREVRRLVPELSARMMDKLEEKLDFRQIVEEKVRGFDLDRLERIIQDIAARELKAIELIGGVLGFLIGLAQAGLALL